MAERVSIILPCFNEGPRIEATLSTLSSWFADIVPEIIVLDDASTDDTVDRAAAAAGRAHVRVHSLSRHAGKGAAIRAAIPLATGDLIVLVDADLPFDRASVTGVLDALQRADMVVANRRHEQSRYTVPVRLFGFLYRRHLVGLTFNLLVRALLQIGLRDTQCGLKGFRREALQCIGPSLTADGFAIDVEMLLAARALGLRVHDVPVLVRYETAASTVRIARSGAAMAAALLRISWRRAAGRYSPARVRAAASSTGTPAARPPAISRAPRTDLEE